MLKIIAIARLYDEDVTDFYLLGIKFRLIARPIKLWHYFDFIYLWGKNAKGGVFFQAPWVTILSLSDDPIDQYDVKKVSINEKTIKSNFVR